jgi:hypothetical protein
MARAGSTSSHAAFDRDLILVSAFGNVPEHHVLTGFGFGHQSAITFVFIVFDDIDKFHQKTSS